MYKRMVFKFQTYVYDTNVGDVSKLSSYFNPERWTITDLNCKFGIQPQDNRPSDTSTGQMTELQSAGDAKVNSLVPKLLIYPKRATAREEEEAAVVAKLSNSLQQVASPCMFDSDGFPPLGVRPVQTSLPLSSASSTLTNTSTKEISGLSLLVPPPGYETTTQGNTGLVTPPSSPCDAAPGGATARAPGGHRKPRPSTGLLTPSPNGQNTVETSLSSLSLSLAIQNISRCSASPVGTEASGQGRSFSSLLNSSCSSSALGTSGAVANASFSSPNYNLASLCHPLDGNSILKAFGSSPSAWRETSRLFNHSKEVSLTSPQQLFI